VTGQGDTPASATGYDMDTLAGDAIALVGALDAGPVHWVGLSMRGFVGMRSRPVTATCCAR